MAETEVPVPPQYKDAVVIDFRNAMLGPRGYKMSNKRKMDEKEEQVLLFGYFLSHRTTVSRMLRILAHYGSLPHLLLHFSSCVRHPSQHVRKVFISLSVFDQADAEANEMQEADTIGVPVQSSKRQKLNIVGIGKVGIFQAHPYSLKLSQARLYQL